MPPSTNTALRCPNCALSYPVSEEDPDSTLTDMVHHLSGAHWLTGDDLTAAMARITEVPADADTWQAHRP